MHRSFFTLVDGERDIIHIHESQYLLLEVAEPFQQISGFLSFEHAVFSLSLAFSGPRAFRLGHGQERSIALAPLFIFIRPLASSNAIPKSSHKACIAPAQGY